MECEIKGMESYIHYKFWVVENLLHDHVELSHVLIDCKSSLVMNAVRVLGADNVPPAEACTASECICCFV